MKKKYYEINEKNIKNHEIIGLNILVIESSDKKKIGIKGKVIDETKNTIILYDGKILPKKECVFEFDIGEKVKVVGKNISKRPADRLK